MEQNDEIIIRKEHGKLIVNDLGMKVLRSNDIAHYHIRDLETIIHGQTDYPIGRDIFVKMLIALLKETPMDAKTTKYYREIVREVLGVSFDSNIRPETMFEALEKADKGSYKLEFHAFPQSPGQLDGWSTNIFLVKDGEKVITRSQDVFEKGHSLKIISYNISRCTQEKIDHLLSMDADFYIVPEMAKPSLLDIPDAYETKWIGDYKEKGLGIIWKRYLDVGESPFQIEMSYFFSMVVEGKLIVAAWPTKVGALEKYSYPKILMEALERLSPDLQRYPTIISGDFNCYVGQSSETKANSIKAIDSFLLKNGYRSLYHSMNGEQLGKENACTYHHLFKPDDSMRFFLDYTYTNIPVKGYCINDWEPKISDHHAQTIII